MLGSVSTRRFAPENVDARLRAGLVGHWLSGGSGLTWFDQSGYGNHGTLTPSTTAVWSMMGLHTDALHLTGGTAGGYVEMADSTSLDLGTGDFSITMWMRPDAGGSDFVFLTKCSTGVGGLAVGVLMELENRKPSLEIRDGAARNQTVAQLALTDYVWQHLAVTRAGTTVSWWINGNAMSVSQVKGTNFGANVDNASNLRLAWNEVIAARCFSGRLADVRIYKRAISDAEVALLARTGFSERSVS